MATPHCSGAIDTKDILTRSTGFSETRMLGVVDRKERIERRERVDLVGRVIGFDSLEGIDPKVDPFRQFFAQRLGVYEMLAQADYTDTVTDAHIAQPLA